MDKKLDDLIQLSRDMASESQQIRRDTALESLQIRRDMAQLLLETQQIRRDTALESQQIRQDMAQQSRDVNQQIQQTGDGASRDMIRIVVGLAVLSNATVIVAAILTSSLSA